MDKAAERQILRDAMRDKRARTNDIFSFNRNILDKLSKIISQHKIIAAYLPMHGEADPAQAAALALEAGKVIALPRTDRATKTLHFHRHDASDPLETGAYGIRQPFAAAPIITPDLLLVPLIAFDRRGNRLGQGGGYYDRALATLPDAVTIGIGWDWQEVVEIPTEAWDRRLDFIATPTHWLTA